LLCTLCLLAIPTDKAYDESVCCSCITELRKVSVGDVLTDVGCEFGQCGDFVAAGLYGVRFSVGREGFLFSKTL